MVRIAIVLLKNAINMQKIYVIINLYKEDCNYAYLKNHRLGRSG